MIGNGKVVSLIVFFLFEITVFPVFSKAEIMTFGMVLLIIKVAH